MRYDAEGAVRDGEGMRRRAIRSGEKGGIAGEEGSEEEAIASPVRSERRSLSFS